jgi:colanic acid biosynthesis protein WcaH
MEGCRGQVHRPAAGVPRPVTLSSAEYQQILQRVPVLCVDGIILNNRGQFLLVKRKNAPMLGEWWVPGGRVLKGETLEAAFRRKMREELGVDVRILMPLGYFEVQHEDDPRGGPGGVHQVSVVFAAVPLNLDVTLDAQSSEWDFFDRLPERFARFESFNRWLAR